VTLRSSDYIKSYTRLYFYFIVCDCRCNLDPEGYRTDDELWEALEIVNMKETIKFMSGQLGR